MTREAFARCDFYARVQVTRMQPTYRYDSIRVETWDGAGVLPTMMPPLVGDLIDVENVTYRVVDRAWHYPIYRSMAWPAGSAWPQEGPTLTIIVEAAEGPFVAEHDDDA